MTEYREPLFQAREIDVVLTNRGIRRLCNRLDFPEDIEHLLEKLRNDLSEGYMGEHNKGRYGKNGYNNHIIDFTKGSASVTGVILLESDGLYLAISAFEKKQTLVLDGDERVRVNWIYNPPEKNAGFPHRIKTYKHRKTKRNHG